MYVCISLLYEDVKFVLISERKIVGVLPKKEPTPKCQHASAAVRSKQLAAATANHQNKNSALVIQQTTFDPYSKIALSVTRTRSRNRYRRLFMRKYFCRRPCLCNFGSVMQ